MEYATNMERISEDIYKEYKSGYRPYVNFRRDKNNKIEVFFTLTPDTRAFFANVKDAFVNGVEHKSKEDIFKTIYRRVKLVKDVHTNPSRYFD